jgi:LuxR family maltose regulon positive regulatory protein
LEGSHHYILDYLLEEVLSRESAPIREFLIRTCLLERFNADSCAALGLEGAQQTLTYLERANLFIIPLDGQRVWYRYHHLFADVLQKQLLHTRPGLAPDLHQRAANWFEAHGLVDEALTHTLQTGDPALPLDLVERHALETILQGRIATAARWLDSLPADALLTRPRLCLDRAWALTFTSQTEAALPYLERAEMLDNTFEARAEIFGLQSYQKSIYGLTAEALRLARLALENSPPDHPFLQCSNRLFLASALVRNGKLDEALKEYRLIQPTCQLQILSGLALLEADFLQFVAMYLNARNQAKRAKALLRDAIQTFETAGAGNRQAAALYLYVGLGKILYIENQLAEAERTLEMGLQLEPLSLSLAAIDGWLTLWWVKTGQRDYRAARHILDDLEPAVRHCDEKISRLIQLPGALQDLLEGKITSATTRLENLGFSDQVDEALAQVSDSELMGWRSNEYFVYARVLAARGKSAASLRVLEHMARVAQAFGMDWLLYRTWITQAMVYLQTGQVEVAVDRLAHLLEKTSRLDSGAVQIYLSTGEPARALLKEAARRGLHPEHVARLLSEFPPEPFPARPSNLPEALTERELDVLRLMADGLRNQEIGEKLYISLNTIRYHTTNIFGKLAVDNRTAAVARARELGIH